ncbi:MAG: FMN-binding protein [Oscillospiraceae bacterium]|nr:FMN-binding protein [Oscillospiraceae bacterium]
MNKVVKLSLILFLVSAVVAGVLGLTNFVTAEPIAEYQAEVTAKAYGAVMEFESYDEVEYTGDQSAVTKVCKTNDGNWIVEAEVSGSQGMITVAVGVNADLTCNGISIIASSETSGLGSKANDDFFRDQFPGLTADQAKVTKDGGSIEAITGATITSKAVCSAVRAAIAAVESLG